VCFVVMVGSGCCRARTHSLAVDSETMDAAVGGTMPQVEAVGFPPAVVTVLDVPDTEGAALKARPHAQKKMGEASGK